MILLTHERHERAFSHARARVFECMSFVHCVCGLCFYLCFVCVPPFSKEGGDVVYEHGGFIGHCRDVLDLHVFVVVGCVRVCSWVRMHETHVPGLAGARAGPLRSTCDLQGCKR